MIEVTCPSCSAQFQVSGSLSGKTQPCPECGAAAEVPAAFTAEDRAEAAVDGKGLGILEDVPLFEGNLASTVTPSFIVDSPLAGDAAIQLDEPIGDEPSPEIVFDKPAAAGRRAGDPSRIDAPVEDYPVDNSQCDAAYDKAIHFQRPLMYLGKLNYYLICDHKDVVARWQNDGLGWMVRMEVGFARASMVYSEIPIYGKFVLVEIGVAREDGQLQLKNITSYQLQSSYALLNLVKSDDAVLGSVTGPAVLNADQREHVVQLVQSKFLPPVWPMVDELL